MGEHQEKVESLLGMSMVQLLQKKRVIPQKITDKITI